MAIDSHDTPQPTNGRLLHDMVDSTLAFHGLRPHVAAQLVAHLASKVVVIELLPVRLRPIADAIARNGQDP